MLAIIIVPTALLVGDVPSPTTIPFWFCEAKRIVVLENSPTIEVDVVMFNSEVILY